MMSCCRSAIVQADVQILEEEASARTMKKNSTTLSNSNSDKTESYTPKDVT
jgi:hypothetical protein